jgi:predicted nucleotidyltransferase
MPKQPSSDLTASIQARVPPLPPSSPRSREEIAAVASSIAERFHPDRIVLFGSHAAGTPTPDSDVDFLVVMDTPLKPTQQAALLRQSVGEHHRYPMDILVRRPDQIALGLAERDFFIEDIVLRGIVLYEASDHRLG